MPIDSDFDILILGGGLVGATFACALGESGLRIGMVEKGVIDTSSLSETFDLRVSAINLATQHIFSALQVWQAMANKRVSPLRRIQVWDENSSGTINFASNEIGEPYLGYIVEHQVMQQALYEHLASIETVTFISSAQPKAFYQGTGQHLLTLADGRQLTSRLAVGADGAQSWLRQQAAIELREQAYGHTAIVAVVKTALAHQNTAWQRFLSDGVLAFLPLAEPNTCSIVWSVATLQAERLLQLDEIGFKQALADSFRQRLGEVLEISERKAFPLIRRHAKQYVKPGIALIGDSAHTIHPLAGQGFNLGAMDAACLAEVILDSKMQGEDWASLNTLRRYERWRKEDVVTLLTAMEGFKRLFGRQLKLMQTVRGIGLNLTNRFTPLKRQLIRHAVGLSGDLPKLAK